MAIVPNKAEPSAIDKKFATHNRTNAGTPIASLVPEYANELVLDTTNLVLWRAIGITNADWELVEPKSVG